MLDNCRLPSEHQLSLDLTLFRSVKIKSIILVGIPALGPSNTNVSMLLFQALLWAVLVYQEAYQEALSYLQLEDNSQPILSLIL